MQKLRISADVAGLIRGLHPALKKKIRGSLQAILNEPYCGKALKEELVGLRSLRVSRFRIIYRVVSNEVIEVVAIGPRNRIYEETFRVIQRETDKSNKA